MVTTVKAVFDGEVLRPEGPVNLRPNTRCIVTVEQLPEEERSGAETPYALTQILAMATDMGVTDLAERHDFYAHGRIEDEKNGA